MTRSDATVKRELPKRMVRGSGPEKRNNVNAMTCKHVTPGGWCNKKQQHCPFLNVLFINQ